MQKESVLGFDVCSYNKQELLKKIFDDYAKGEKLFIVNVNPEIAVSNYKNDNFKAKLNNQKYQIPDGTGIVWASNKNKGKIQERITGIDLMLSILEKSEQYLSRVFLYGSRQEVVEKAKNEIEKKHSKINIVGICNGYEDEEIALSKIQKTNPDIVFVALGSPKQEEFILKNIDKMKSVKIIMPVGGALDVISKTKKRAPNWMIKCNIEWLYRLFQEPKRIFRQIKLVKFLYIVLKNKKGEKNG